jgi:hypothetical protein
VAVPAAIPESSPAPVTVATEVGVLVHVPPIVASLKSSEVPIQRARPPEITAGTGLTEILFVTVHPTPNE